MELTAWLTAWLTCGTTSLGAAELTPKHFRNVARGCALVGVHKRQPLELSGIVKATSAAHVARTSRPVPAALKPTSSILPWQ